MNTHITASGFTRVPGSEPGTPWVPKAIVEALQFNGDGTLTTPGVTVANPFGDSGDILHPRGSGDFTRRAQRSRNWISAGSGFPTPR